MAKSIDFELCYICEKKNRQSGKLKFVKKPTHSSILKIITVTNERYLHGESFYEVLLTTKPVTKILLTKQM